MSAVVYDVGYDTRMIKKRRNMVTVRLLIAKKKTERHRSPKKYIKILKHTLPYLNSEYRNLRHTIPLTISNSDYDIKPFKESFLRFYI